MKKIETKTIVVVFAFLAASCASHKNFDFKNAYKFDRINYKKTSESIPNKVEIMDDKKDKADLASIKDIPDELDPVIPAQIESRYNPQQLPHNTLVAQNTSGIQTLKDMTRSERKQFKRELRRTIRDIKNEQISERDRDKLMASIAGVTSVQDDADANKKRRIARYLLIGGGALVIIAVIVGSFSIVGTIGVVAVIAGAVLMLLSLDK